MGDGFDGLWAEAYDTFVALPLAAALGAALAFRPRRRGTPTRNPAVIETQVILAIMGALVMIVVGASVARAFGIVGAASLIRYRAKIGDPKDAAVMLSTLGVGLAVGGGLYWVAATATIFILIVLALIESLRAPAVMHLQLTVAADAPTRLRPTVERVLAEHHARAELRSLSPSEMVYSVRMPAGAPLTSMLDTIVRAEQTGGVSVTWDDKRG